MNRHGCTIKLDRQLTVCCDAECRRNELVALDLVITAVSTMFAFVAMIGELFILIRNSPLVAGLAACVRMFVCQCAVGPVEIIIGFA